MTRPIYSSLSNKDPPITLVVMSITKFNVFFSLTVDRTAVGSEVHNIATAHCLQALLNSSSVRRNVPYLIRKNELEQLGRYTQVRIRCHILVSMRLCLYLNYKTRSATTRIMKYLDKI